MIARWQKVRIIMQIVIDITEEAYNILQNDGVDWLGAEHILDRVANGTPLPKGHGKIGDLDVLREEVSSWGMNDYEPSDFIDAIDQADTIIEADTKSEDS